MSDGLTSFVRIPRIQGGQECTLTATAELTSTTTRQVWARPPIDVDFQVLMFTASGLIVRFLKVFEKSGYTSIKWVRYLTKAAGTYQIRVSGSKLPRGLISFFPSSSSVNGSCSA
jgi:AP-2 complex subunit mu-1